MRFLRIAFVALCLGLPLGMMGCQDEPADTGTEQEATETKDAPEKPAEEKPAEGEQK